MDYIYNDSYPLEDVLTALESGELELEKFLVDEANCVGLTEEEVGQLRTELNDLLAGRK